MLTTKATIIPPFLPILASALLHHVKLTKLENKWRRFGVMAGTAALFYSLPPHSFACWWNALTLVLCQWSRLFDAKSNHTIFKYLVHGGPLGRNCAKVCEVVAACLLWRLLYRQDPLPIVLGPMPSVQTWMIVTILSGLVNIVLLLWSRHVQSRGNHEGVHSMVESSVGKRLHPTQHVVLAFLALVNATCEEVASRGFWYHEYQQRGGLSPNQANVVQAVCFGIWHYHGIPSGFIGVGLTFVYGLIMGFLYEYDGRGLRLPIVAHTVADYFIFVIIARQQIGEPSSTRSSNKEKTKNR